MHRAHGDYFAIVTFDTFDLDEIQTESRPTYSEISDIVAGLGFASHGADVESSAVFYVLPTGQAIPVSSEYSTAPNAASPRCEFCGDEMTDNESTCPSCWQRSIDPNAPGADPNDFTYEDRGYSTVVRPKADPGISYVFPNPPFEETPEERSPDAPNAANAAPLMPICEWCKGTGWDAKYTPRNGIQFPEETPCYNCNGTGRERGTREGFPTIIRPGHLGADESLPAYAWPGGYPLAYYPCAYAPPWQTFPEHAEMVGDVLCPDCATAELHEAAQELAANDLDPDTQSDLCFIASIEEEVSDHNLTCDNCHAVIAYQTYCHDCGESVDCDEANPFHLCPVTEPYTVWYLPTVPSDEWKAFRYDPEGPERAKEIAHSLRVQGLAAFVHVQPSRLDFPPVISDEEEESR